jgi:TRAP-type C4-dicarboxylate transport system substrate-binding protein
MNRTKRHILGLAGAVALSALATGFATTAALAQEVTLRLHQFLPAQANVPTKVLDVWADQIEAQSDGRIEIQRFPSMQLGGKPPELIDQVIDGVADIVWTVSGYTPGRFPRTEVFELPFMMTNAEATSRAYWQLAEAEMMDQDFKDFKVLGLWVHGPGLIHSKTPIEQVADLNGVKLRAPTRVANMLFSSLGATAVGMPVPAVPEALSKGVIDATVIPWEVTGALKISELVSSHTTFGDASLYTTTFIFAMNQGVYDGLSDDLKAIIDANSGEEFSAMAGKQMQADDEPSRQIAVERGNTIIELSPEQVEAWRTASQGIIDTWEAEMDEKGIGGTKLVEEARALIAKNTGLN